MKKNRNFEPKRIEDRQFDKPGNPGGTDTNQVLSQVNYIGYGFDIFGEDNSSSKVTPLLDPQKAKVIPFEMDGTSYDIPGYILATENTNSDFHSGYAETRNEFQNDIAAKAKIKGNYGAFSGEMKAAYAKQISQSAKYTYAWNNYFLQLAILDLVLDGNKDYRADSFIRAIEALPVELSEKTYPQFEEFFVQFGSYYISRMSLGGTFKYYCATSKNSELSETDISASLKAQYTGLTQSGSVNTEVVSKETYASYNSNTSVNMMLWGGDTGLQSNLNTLDPTTNNPEGPTDFENWVNSIPDAPNSFGYELSEISDLCGNKKEVVKDALEIYLEKGMRSISINMSDEELPVVILDSPLVPKKEVKERGPGWQLIILDRSDPTPNGVLFNKYYEMDEVPYVDSKNYPKENEKLCDKIVEDITRKSLNNSQNFIVLASFRTLYDGNCPNESLYSLLKSAGGGEKLDKWREKSKDFSQVPTPTKYCLVGIFDSGVDTGIEAFGKAPKKPTVETQVLFYKDGAPNYTLGPGETV